MISTHDQNVYKRLSKDLGGHLESRKFSQISLIHLFPF